MSSKKNQSIRRSDFYLVPNILTLSRTIAVPLVAWFAWKNWNLAAALTFALAGLSDYVDGWIARRFNAESKLGMLLDPLSDKLIVVSTMIMLLWLRRLEDTVFTYKMDLLPPILVIVTVGREIAITGLRSIASTVGIVMPADRLGKLKTWVQFWAIFLILGDWSLTLPLGHGLLMFSVVTACLSGIGYIRTFVKNLPH